MGLTMLLWRCPLCRHNDALCERHRWPGQHRLHCRACGATWRIERVPGDDYYLELLAGARQRVGERSTVAAWYREMKAGLSLDAISDNSLGLPPGEVLYLRAAHVDLVVNAANPLPARGTADDPPELAGGSGESLFAFRKVGRGQLYLTAERLLWRCRGTAHSWPWRGVNSVFWFLSNLGIMYGAATYRFHMPREHVLKWLTYADLLAPQIRAQCGHIVSVSFY